MQVMQALDGFMAYGTDLGFRHCVIVDNVSQRACLLIHQAQPRAHTSFHVLHNDPELRLYKERVKIVYNVFMIGFFHDNDLIDNQFFAGLRGEFHLLYGNGSAVLRVFCQVLEVFRVNLHNRGDLPRCRWRLGRLF